MKKFVELSMAAIFLLSASCSSIGEYFKEQERKNAEKAAAELAFKNKHEKFLLVLEETLDQMYHGGGFKSAVFDASGMDFSVFNLQDGDYIVYDYMSGIIIPKKNAGALIISPVSNVTIDSGLSPLERHKDTVMSYACFIYNGKGLSLVGRNYPQSGTVWSKDLDRSNILLPPGSKNVREGKVSRTEGALKILKGMLED
ncbi:MAG: hypothetical protein LBR23_07685 [Spirochaetaceae bacterium]|jgi:hypothetical protein|nr:hypothetical protein [Spirochaetaceae bacterium]